MSDVNTILNAWLEPVGKALNTDAARLLLDLRADPATQNRVEELADRNTEGTLTSDERQEYESLVNAATLINVLKGKARARLAAESTAVA
jgi:hypothetical protein